MSDPSERIDSFERVIRGCVVSPNQDLADCATALWPENKARWSIFERGGQALDHLFTDPPDLNMIMKRTSRNLDANPLTRLPGTPPSSSTSKTSSSVGPTSHSPIAIWTTSSPSTTSTASPAATRP